MNGGNNETNIPRINYVIATWDGRTWNDSGMSGRYIMDQIGKPKADEILSTHLEYLSKLKHSLAQITIMKPTKHDKPKYDDYYIKMQQALDECKFSCPVIIVESDFYTLYSYGQWLHAYELYRNQFDYYIFVEDDTVGAIPNFDLILMNFFKTRVPNQLGYLCTKRDYEYRWNIREHMAITTGITNSKTLSLLFQTFGEGKDGIYEHLLHQLNKYVGITDHPFSNGNLMQVNFSLLFTKISTICDYSDQFLCPFWDQQNSRLHNRHIYREYATSDKFEPLIMPIQMSLTKDFTKCTQASPNVLGSNPQSV